MLIPHLQRPNTDPFRPPQRWLLRLGTRFYYPIAFVAGLLLIGIVVNHVFRTEDFWRRLIDLTLLAGGCVALLFWRAERLWLRGRVDWLVRFARPDLAFLWAGAATFFITIAIALTTYLSDFNPLLVTYLWPLFLFPLLFLSERGDTAPFLFVTACACFQLFLLRLPVSNTFAEAFTPPFWLGLLATSNYYLARRHLLLELRVDLLHQISSQLSNTPDVEASFEAIAELIGRRLRHAHVRLWSLAPDGMRLVLQAAWGTPKAKWLGQQRPYLDAGVPGEVLHTQAAVRQDKLKTPEPKPFAWVRSALGVPILVGSQVVGVLEVVSPHADDFWDSDIGPLVMLADAIGVALARSQHVRQEAQRLRDTLATALSAIGDCNSIQEMFDEIARFAREKLGSDLVVLYQLAPGTGYPLAPPLFTGDFYYPEQVRHPILPPDSVLFDLLERWEPYYSSEATRDPVLSRGNFWADPNEAELSIPYGIRNRFLAREAVQGVAFLPLGSRSKRVGALFLHYRQPRDFSPLTKLTLEAFATLVAEPINRERAHWRKYEAFGGVLFGVHGPLTLSADAIRRLAGSAQDKLFTEPEQAAEALGQALKVTRKLEMAAMLTRLAKRDELEATGLRDELRRGATKLVQFMEPNCRVTTDIPPEVDDLPLELLDALYCLAMEAVANATFHGRAKRIEIGIEIDDDAVHLAVSDNGSGFDVEAARHGPNGIFEATELVQQQFAATGSVSSTPGQGTQIKVTFPCLADVVGGE